MCCALKARCKSLKLNPQMHISIIEIAGKCILKGHNVCKKNKCTVLSNILFLKISDGFNAYSVTAFHNEFSKQKPFRRKQKLHRNRTTNCTSCAGLSRTSTVKYAIHPMKYTCGESGKFVCIFNFDVIKWKHCPRYWPFVWGIHRSPVNSPHKGQWRGALIFSLICAWIHGYVKMVRLVIRGAIAPIMTSL